MSESGDHDPIYRGQEPLDAAPLPPYIPSSATPGYRPPPPTPDPPKKKRWPWIVGAMVLFCGLPLGGCVALLGVGLNELDERSDAIEDVVNQYFIAVRSGDEAAIEALSDGLPPCDVLQADPVPLDIDVAETDVFEVSRISFSDRSENSTFSQNAGPDGVTISGREGESAARVTGVIIGTEPAVDYEITLTKPLVSWKICTVSGR